MANPFLNPRTYAQITGIALAAVALVGTIMSIVGQDGYSGLFCGGGEATCQGETATNDSILGFDWGHNAAHWILAIVALYIGFFAPANYASLYAKVFGIVYLGLGGLGFVWQGVAMFHLELGENLIHLVIGLWGATTGFFGTTTSTTATPTGTATPPTGKA